MGVATIAAIAAVAGAAASAYGANKNAKAAAKASDQNAQNVAATNALNYQQWLESRGVGSNGQPINAKLPRYMNWTMPGQPRQIIGYKPIAGYVAPASPAAPAATPDKYPASKPPVGDPSSEFTQISNFGEPMT